MNDQILEIKPGQVLLVTGPNNSGKTTFLREILDHTENGSTSPTSRKIIKSASFKWNLSAELKEQFIENHFPNVTDSAGLAYQLPQELVRPYQLERSIKSRDGLRDLVSAFVKFDNALDRIQESDFKEKTDAVTNARSAPEHPIEKISSNQNLFKQLTTAFHEIFFDHLTLDDYGRQTGFRLGEDNFAQTHRRQPTSHEELNHVRNLPAISEQGFGIRATLGLLMSLLSGQESLVLIDEPEAFLHPPQAKKLSEVIARIARKTGKVIIIATHDRNIINGAANNSESKTSLIHLNRSGTETTFKLVDFESLTQVKSNALIRYSPILEALFHKVTVIVEGESDAVFYSAAFEHFLDRTSHRYSISPSDILILPVGGKDSQATTTEVLKQLDCEAIVISDFDIFSDAGQLRKIWRSISNNNEWDLLNKPYREIINTINKARVTPSVHSVFDRFEHLKKEFDNDANADFDQLKKEINQALKSSSPWTKLKEFGSSDDTFGSDFDHIRKTCLEGRLAIVPGGEVESFGRGVPSFEAKKSSDWAMLAINAGVHEAEPTTAFIAEILSTVFKKDNR